MREAGRSAGIKRMSTRPEAAGSVSLLRKLGWFCVALFSLSLTIVACLSLLSDLYAGLAAQKREQLGTSPVALQSAKFAARLAPWKATAWGEYSYNAIRAGNSDEALSAIAEAIYWQPADAMQWHTLTQIRLRTGPIDRQLMTAASYIALLAPNASNLQMQLALDGVYWWKRGDESLRQVWLRAIHTVLQRQRDIFLIALVTSHQEAILCERSGKALGLVKWCEWALYMRHACVKADLPQDQRAFCRQIGFIGVSKP